MATITAYPETAVAVREHPAMRWGAVFAGWFVATGIAVLLYVFGLAVGFTAFDPYIAAITHKGISGGAVAWMILTWGAALWIGGMFASWFDGGNDTEMGVIRGLTVWGLSVTATALLIATGLTHAMFITMVQVPVAPTMDQDLLAHYTAVTMWTAFGSAALALITSAFGGWLGAHHVHRVYHLRTYPPHGRA
jgi:hypothetical protein